MGTKGRCFEAPCKLILRKADCLHELIQVCVRIGGAGYIGMVRLMLLPPSRNKWTWLLAISLPTRCVELTLRPAFHPYPAEARVNTVRQPLGVSYPLEEIYQLFSLFFA
jgi:hypothetical protein